MSSLNTLERLIEEELDAMEAHQEEEEKVGDPKLKLVFHRLAELRAQGVAALQSYLNEVRPIAEVTRQINEMF
ncbi:MAG: hypothetical protein A3H45_00135 [Ignavibacteria bacterium RIFCSPLOWO2_02_FULL_55_14]|nr:MAG: hypothetical protein A2X68_13670 [Ignavibacteria bacterium GWC2_56_12]OGU72365.1 MAG: hypothetical protein A3H45_00135 [Ignavibacteria bacterium RIFCSPLOWO2_02_FULL_55_14]OGU75781.1 MAG: hypothetical protein A3G43_04700 [Ignavibacteria bacterium RIFCSPLOWO2_12_FULL_56_21]HAV23128.1 hypothetical protein [Bacteroidota bacterium]